MPNSLGPYFEKHIAPARPWRSRSLRRTTIPTLRGLVGPWALPMMVLWPYHPLVCTYYPFAWHDLNYVRPRPLCEAVSWVPACTVEGATLVRL